MVETTKHSSELTREELAAYLGELAEGFGHDDTVTVNVGNKQVTLDLAPTVECSVVVEERSKLLRGDSERLTVTVDWDVAGG